MDVKATSPTRDRVTNHSQSITLNGRVQPHCEELEIAAPICLEHMFKDRRTVATPILGAEVTNAARRRSSVGIRFRYKDVVGFIRASPRDMTGNSTGNRHPPSSSLHVDG
jgi:hypothetical protein